MAEITVGVKTLDAQQMEVALLSTATVRDLKSVLEERLEVPTARQRLLYRSHLLDDSRQLSSYGIQGGSQLSLVANAQREAVDEAEANDPFTDLLRLVSASPAALISRRSRRPNARRDLTEGERIEAMRQSLLTLQGLMDIRNRENADSDSGFDFSRRVLAKGMWVDVKDTVDQWLEAQVIDIRTTQAGTMVFIHYNGWPTRWDEWIDVRSPRIQPLRSKTFQSISAPMHSPYPVVSPDPPEPLPTPPTDLPDTALHISRFLTHAQTMMERYYRLNTILRHERNAGVAAGRPSSYRYEEGKQQSTGSVEAEVDSEEWSETMSVEDEVGGEVRAEDGGSMEQEVNLLSGQMAPILDRFGRLLCDLGVTISKDVNQQMGQRGDFPAASTMPTPAELYALSGSQFGQETGMQIALFTLRGRPDSNRDNPA